MPLKIDLKPGERFILNGAVISVGKDGRSLVLENTVSMLRDRDVMHDDEVTSPARRIYFAVQNMYIDPSNAMSHEEAYQRYTLDLVQTTRLADMKKALMHVVNDVANAKYYRALKTLRSVIAVEDALLAGEGIEPQTQALNRELSQPSNGGT